MPSQCSIRGRRGGLSSVLAHATAASAPPVQVAHFPSRSPSSACIVAGPFSRCGRGSDFAPAAPVPRLPQLRHLSRSRSALRRLVRLGRTCSQRQRDPGLCRPHSLSSVATSTCPQTFCTLCHCAARHRPAASFPRPARPTADPPLFQREGGCSLPARHPGSPFCIRCHSIRCASSSFVRRCPQLPARSTHVSCISCLATPLASCHASCLTRGG